MKYCPTCKRTFEDALVFCLHDGEVLQDSPENLVGLVLDGRYEVESFIAQGGMGTLYLARDIMLGARVLIKALRFEMRQIAGRFQAEWLRRLQRAALRLRHPNAVTVYDLSATSDGLIYMAMEYVEGHTLDQELKRRGRFTPREALEVLEPVADALDAAHALDIVHRDMKPENVMLGADNYGRRVVKLLDLGIAEMLGMADATAGQIPGTPYYMSPEQWGDLPRDGNSEIDGRTDIYSLGVIFYELVSGRKPHGGRTLAEIRQPLDEVVPSIPADFARAVERAMARDRNDRYPTAGEFIADLRRSLELLPHSAPKSGALTTASETRELARLAVQACEPCERAQLAADASETDEVAWLAAPTLTTKYLPPAESCTAASEPSRVETRLESAPASARRLKGILLLPFGVLAAGVCLVADAATAAWEVGQHGKEKLKELAVRTSDKLFAAKHDDVTCTVFAPPSAPPGDTVLVQVFAHLKEQDEIVQSYAKKFDQAADMRGRRALNPAVRRGATLAFHLRMPGLIVDEPDQEIAWRGEAESVQFGVTVPGGREPGDIIGTVTVTQDSVPIGHIKFKFTVAPRAGKQVSYPAASPATDGEFVRYRLAFISYASEDRKEVLKRVQMLDRARIRYFQDVLKLEPGARWEKELYKHIDDCDVFFLFWSRAAKKSSWVRREALYAHARKKGRDDSPPEILPVIIEGPPPTPPPEELSFLHFNDKFIYFINARDG